MMSSCRTKDKRYISRAKWNNQQAMKHNTGNHVQYERTELDSRADICCLGSSYQVIEYTGQVCEVHLYHPKYKPTLNVPVVTAFEDKITGDTFIICLNQGLYFGDNMKHSLLNQNQIRANGIVVDDCPVHLSPDRSSTHSILFPDEGVRIQLQPHGCMSYFPIRLPTEKELRQCKWLDVTSYTEWQPYSPKFEDGEANAVDSRKCGAIRTDLHTVDCNELRSISSVHSLRDTLDHPVMGASV